MENDNSLQVLSICYNNLDPKIKNVLSRRFGLHGYNQETLEEISKDLGCSRENVRRLQALGIGKLQLLLRKHSM
ncbi:TPA: hypothetical protein P0E24_001846 [Vibrio campbellii]|uniref:sigma factor-like helix-turn-helix DNA-binding protein n=1 Tax=Vibrio sp. M260121 TaxID=3020897 RepID=UPI0032F80A44|nr:hypothetical protein [Vibrio campbellii]HDM8242778.1 hypothetical protein [Vibrio campbellii]